MASLTPLDRLLQERTTRRLALAQHRVARLLDATCDEPFDLAVIGSLAAGTFALHSDVDLLVRGDVDSAGRVRVEQAVAAAMRGSGIPYDLIFAADLTPARRAEFEHDLVEPSRLRETWAEARTHLPGIA